MNARDNAWRKIPPDLDQPYDFATAAADIRRAIEAFMSATTEARKLAAKGKAGAELDDVLRHAAELLDIIDEALLEFDPELFGEVVAAAPALRAMLDKLRYNLRGGNLH